MCSSDLVGVDGAAGVAGLLSALPAGRAARTQRAAEAPRKELESAARQKMLESGRNARHGAADTQPHALRRNSPANCHAPESATRAAAAAAAAAAGASAPAGALAAVHGPGPLVLDRRLR